MTSLPSLLTAASAEWWLEKSEWTLMVSAIVLAVGIVGEWPEAEYWRHRTLYKAAKAAVLLGVIGELAGDGGIFLASAKLQELQQIAINNAQTEAANAIFEAERVKLIVLWRDIPPANMVKFRAALAASGGSVTLAWVAGDPETLNFAGILLEAFSTNEYRHGGNPADWPIESLVGDTGKWRVVLNPRQYIDQAVTGIFIPDTSNKAMVLLRNAFTEAGISFNPGNVPPTEIGQHAVQMNGEPITTEAFIMVGSKGVPR